MKELIGKKVKGFKFNSEGFKLGYTDLMDIYINKIGEIIDVCNIFECCKVKFNDGETWSYPTELIKKQLELQYEVTMIAEAPKEVFNPQQHYFNEPKQFRSLFELSHILELNDWEFDILKRLVRCRKKGQFVQDIKKIKDTADIYLNEFKEK